MKIIVIGLGSMGRRRIRLLRQYDESFEIIGVDCDLERRMEVAHDYGIEVYSSISECEDNADVAFVCTSPLSHQSVISECLHKNLHVFTELNLISDGYADNLKLAEMNNVKLFLSSTFLYRDEIKYIDNRVQHTSGSVDYIYHVGQYLPDWHPWENVQDFFVSDKRTNGCREIFAIELPWIQKVFSPIKNIQVKKSKITKLGMEYDDNYLVLIEHENGNRGMLAVDVVSRKAVRNLEIYGENIYLKWDGSPTGLVDYDIDTKEDKNVHLYSEVDRIEGYSTFIIENAYMNEIKAFFKHIKNEGMPLYGFEEDLTTLKWIDEIEGVYV